MEQGRTGSEWRQAGQDQRAWEDQIGARQDRTRGRRRTKLQPGRTRPVGVEGRAEGLQESSQHQLSTSVHQSEAEDRVDAQRCSSLQQFQNQPASDEGGEGCNPIC